MTLPEILHLSTNFITQKNGDLDLAECCHLNSTVSNYCFKWNNLNEPIFNKHKRHYACLPARYVTDKTTCFSGLECGPNVSQTDGQNGQETICVKPVSDNSTKLVKIVHDRGAPVLYVGSVDELIYSSISFF